jgi:SAM-dependent methyltransferase
MSTHLADAWESEAQRWIEWARKPGHDSYWQYHRDQFLPLLPAPSGPTVDIGCGEGRLPRDLKKRGYEVMGVDVSPTLVEAARKADPGGQYLVGNANALPIDDGCFRLATAFMSLQDVDDLDGATAEIARVLQPGGHACIAIVHPINSTGNFQSEAADSVFTIDGSYLSERTYCDTFERDGLSMTFHSRHRPLDTYSRSFERAGFLIEAIRENAVPDAVAAQSPRSARWQRIPLFLHFRLRMG